MSTCRLRSLPHGEARSLCTSLCTSVGARHAYGGARHAYGGLRPSESASACQGEIGQAGQDILETLETLS